MRKLDNLLVAQIIELRREGFSHKLIARKLGVSIGSVFNYTKNIVLPLKAKRILFLNAQKNRAKFSANYANEKQVTLPKLDAEFVLVLGHLFF